MRRRAWAAWGLAAAGLALAVAARSLPAGQVWSAIAGLLLLAAIGLGLSLLPVWRRMLPSLPPMGPLFARPTPSERWCTRCGNATPRKGACRVCGHTPASRGGKA